jgi:hypothetical protein
MRHTITTCLLWLMMIPLTGQNATLPKYRVMKSSSIPGAIASLNQAADQGYRLLLEVGRFAIMRLDAAPPDTYRYLPFREDSGRASLLNGLNQEGALGYKLLEFAPVLGKEPHPRNYEYSVTQGIKKKVRDRSRASLLEQGFHPVAEVLAGEIFIREIGDTQAAARSKQVRVAKASRTGKLMKEINKLAGQGYRYCSTGPCWGSGSGVAMEECCSTCGGPFQYRSFKIDTSVQLDHELNALGREGFQIVPKSLKSEPHLVERPAVHARSFAYRVFEISDERTAEQFLNVGDLDGFVPIGGTVHAGWKHTFIILEKSAAP